MSGRKSAKRAQKRQELIAQEQLELQAQQIEVQRAAFEEQKARNKRELEIAGANAKRQRELLKAQTEQLKSQANEAKQKKLDDEKNRKDLARRLRLRGVALRTGLSGKSLKAAEEGGDFFSGEATKSGKIGRKKLLSTFAEAA